MAHSAANVYGLFQEPTDSFLGVTGGQLLSQEDYAKDPDKGYLGSFQWLIANALKPNDLLGIANARPALFRARLHRFLQTASQHLATMTLVGENRPSPDNRVVLSDRRDPYGFPLARVTHAYGADDRTCFATGLAQDQAIFKAAGAYEVRVSGRTTTHLMGGTIMGRTAADSVTNSYGQTHEIPNLFIAGPGLFPTSGAVNPTFTLHALSLRAADYLLDHWASVTAG